MPIDPKEAGKLVSSGVSFICALCEHYWEGRQFGSCRKSCGGPFSGMTFPLYKGPLQTLEGRCFVCGNPSIVMTLAVPTSDTRLGLCSEHEHLPSSIDTVYNFLLIPK